MRRVLAAVAMVALVAAMMPAVSGATPPAEEVLAFPSAAGFGAHSLGGRGGDVYIVTSLADSGPGSVRDALQSADGPRTVVFEVAGEVRLESPLRFTGSRLTLAGQTSPGGITFSGYPTEIVDSSDVVIRYLRFRPGDRNAAAVPGRPGRGNADLVGDAADALTIISSENVMIDHVSASWSMDETLSVTKSADVTVQHSIISESLDDSFHTEGPHGFGSLVRGTGSRGYSFIGNLWAHHQRRMPAIGGQQDPPPPGEPGNGLDIDLVNNLMYDWRLFASHVLHEPYDLRVNLVGNIYAAGPSLELCACPWANWETGAEQLQVFHHDNLVDMEHGARNEWEAMADSSFLGPVTLVEEPFDFAREPIEELAPSVSGWEILLYAGASIDRDVVDLRVAIQTLFSVGGVIDSQDEVGGWPTIESRPPAVDHDRDGMADDWEITVGLDPKDPTDHADYTLDASHTNIEVYFESLIPSAHG